MVAQAASSGNRRAGDEPLTQVMTLCEWKNYNLGSIFHLEHRQRGDSIMTSREFFLERRRAENPVFLRLMQAVPADRIDYRPHERSPSAEQIMWTMTKELRACVTAATEKKAEWNTEPPPPFAEMLRLFDQWLTELTDSVE